MPKLKRRMMVSFAALFGSLALALIGPGMSGQTQSAQAAGVVRCQPAKPVKAPVSRGKKAPVSRAKKAHRAEGGTQEASIDQAQAPAAEGGRIVRQGDEWNDGQVGRNEGG